MKNLLMILSICLAIISTSANATLLTIEVEDKPYAIGDTLVANIIVSDIETSNSGFQKEVAGFGLDLLFDDSLLSGGLVSFGNHLDLGIGGSFPISDVNAGDIFISEISLMDAFSLAFEQMLLDEFLLASVQFEVSSLGVLNLTLDNIVLTDAQSSSFINVSGQGTSLTLGDVAQVPVPASALLLCLPLLFVMRKFQSK